MVSCFCELLGRVYSPEEDCEMKIFLKKGDLFQEITVTKDGPKHYCGVYGNHNDMFTEIGEPQRQLGQLVDLHYTYGGGFHGHSCGRSGYCKPHPTTKADLALYIFGALEADHAPKDANVVVVDAKVKDRDFGYTEEIRVAFFKE
jgi:hypothetical protein